jgi:uncharacterized membrane protein
MSFFTKDKGKIILDYFIQGLIILAPIAITIWAIIGLFNFVDSITPAIIERIFPDLLGIDANGKYKKIPGLGFIIVILIVILVGWISSGLLAGRLVNLFDKLLEKTPGIKIIYGSVKDFLEAFAGDKKKFTRPVIVNVDGPDVWRLGFITQDDMENFGLSNHYAVYVPHSYAISGIVYIVPKDKVKQVNNISTSEAMKFAVSGGVTDFE